MSRNIISLALTSAITIPLLNPITPAHSQTIHKPTVVTFFCNEIYDSASGQKIPATFAWLPEKQGNVAIIGWKSQFFAQYGWTAQQRCENVTPKFQEAYDSGRLQYLTTGLLSGYPVVCAIVKEEEVCDSTNQLFTLKPNDEPFKVLQQLMELLTGKASDILYQSSGGREYVPMPDFFKKAPILDHDSPCRLKGMGANLRCRPSKKQH
jgi:Circadian oscillating protein COP23